MRVLLHDADDNTLILLSAEHVNYDPEAQELYINSENHNYTVQRIIQANAESIIHDLFENGRTDLTQYQATYDA